MSLIWDEAAQDYIDDGSDDYSYDWGAETDAGDDAWLSAIYSDPSRALDTVKTPEDAENFLTKITDKFGTAIANGVKNLIFKPGTNEINTSGLATIGGALFSLMGGDDKKYASAGYTKKIPTLNATRQQIPYAADPNRRPGEAGRQYFTDQQYTDAAGVPAAQTAANTQAQEILAAYTPRPAAVNPYAGTYKPAWNPAVAEPSAAPLERPMAASGVASLMPVPKAQGFQTPPPESVAQTQGIASLPSSDFAYSPEMDKIGIGDFMSDQFKKDQPVLYSTPSNPAQVSKYTGLDSSQALLASQSQAGKDYLGSQAQGSQNYLASLNQASNSPTTQVAPTFAAGGLAAGGFVVPADVVAHFGNGSSSSGLALLAEKLNAKPIKGDGDGMSDSIPTHIDGKEKALVANDEAYIEPDMVAKIGGGNIKAGSEKLYAMMEKIRKARTGNPEQGKKINAEKFMPGGIAQLAGGGEIRRFTEGGLSSSLSPWAGDYVTNMLGKTEALVNAPQQNYTGPLTAGASDLQQQAFAGIGAAAQAGYKPTTYASDKFGATQAQEYMDPFLSAALTPQLDEMRRQAAITRNADAGRMTRAGAFGGSRQAIMESEGNRNLLEKQTQAIGTGYQTAYDKAMGQFNVEQDRRLNTDKATEASRQYSADYGLKSLGDLATMGATQRGIESEGVAADKAQWEEQRDYPAAMLQFQRKMLADLPLSPQKSTESTTLTDQITKSIAGGKSVEQALRDLGVIT